MFKISHSIRRFLLSFTIAQGDMDAASTIVDMVKRLLLILLKTGTDTAINITN